VKRKLHSYYKKEDDGVDREVKVFEDEELEGLGEFAIIAEYHKDDPESYDGRVIKIYKSRMFFLRY
jgi:hypothetical protein